MAAGKRRRAGARSALGALAVAGALGTAGCGKSDDPPPPETRPRLEIGLTEPNPNLVWPRSARPVMEGAFSVERDQLDAVSPTRYRLVVKWSEVQPRRSEPPKWDTPDGGCLRAVPPCAGYRGVLEQLHAIRARQAAAGSRFDVLVTFLFPPPWATVDEGEGCQPPGLDPRARGVAPDALPDYRALIESLLALARREGVELRWWSPWNEPNAGAFIAPQRSRCDASASSLGPPAYARLARQMRAALAAAPGEQEIALGELSSASRRRSTLTEVGEFVRALPADVACLGDVWTHHEYVGDRPVLARLLAALDQRGCPRPRRIWITETGVGGDRPGQPRPRDGASLRAGCRAQHALLRAWYRHPRVDAAFQYTFREDDRFPVGLVDTRLRRSYPTLDLWRAWGGSRRPGDPPPDLPAACRDRLDGAPVGR